MWRWLRVGALTLLVLVAVVVGGIGLYTFLYADHFVGAKMLSRDVRWAGDPLIQLQAQAHDHWRKLGAMYLAIAGFAGLLACFIWRGTPPWLRGVIGFAGHFARAVWCLLLHRKQYLYGCFQSASFSVRRFVKCQKCNRRPLLSFN